MQEALDKIVALAKGERPSYVVTPNVDHIICVEKDKEFAQIYANADLVLADGKPLLWMAKWNKTPLKEKVSGSDLFPRLCEKAAQEGLRMFFLGAAEGVADIAAENLKIKHPGLNVIGTYSPPFDFEMDQAELDKIIELIRESAPNILIVCMGTPKQEKFIYRHLNALNVPVSLGLGASLDFEAGVIKRAPQWMRNCGLEWLYRLIKEPKRMFRRYIINDMKIFSLYRKYRKNQ